MTTHRVSFVSMTSRGLVLDLIRSLGPISRVELAEHTGLTQATMSHVVRALLADELVVEGARTSVVDRVDRGIGKPRIMLSINPTVRYAIGVQLGADSTTYVVSDLGGAVVGRLRAKGIEGSTPDRAVATIATTVDRLVSDLDIPRGRIAGIGIVASGPIDLTTGSLLRGSAADPWSGYPIQESVRTATGLTVLLDNDATAAAIGEFWGGAISDADAHGTVYMGASIGVGIVLGGTVYRGASSNTGELGQMLVPAPDLPTGRATLDEVAGPQGVAARARAGIAAGRRTTITLSDDDDAFEDFTHVATAAVRGDAYAVELVTESARALGDAVVTLANLLDLDSIVLAGPSFSTAGSLYLEVVADRLDTTFSARAKHPVVVQLSAHVADTAAVGAAALVLQHDLAPRAMGVTHARR